MQFITVTGSRYEIINRENIEKNGVFIFKYVLLGSVEQQFVGARPKPHITDYGKVRTEPTDFRIGDHIVFYTKDQHGQVNKKKLHITAPIKKIKQNHRDTN